MLIACAQVSAQSIRVKQLFQTGSVDSDIMCTNVWGIHLEPELQAFFDSLRHAQALPCFLVVLQLAGKVLIAFMLKVLYQTRLTLQWTILQYAWTVHS